MFDPPAGGPRLSATDPTVKRCMSLDPRRGRRKEEENKKPTRYHVHRTHVSAACQARYDDDDRSDVTRRVHTRTNTTSKGEGNKKTRKKNRLRRHVRRLRFVPSACYAAAAATGMHTEKRDEQNGRHVRVRARVNAYGGEDDSRRNARRTRTDTDGSDL